MIRFAIWAAVSTESQAAADKISLPEQESKCRAAGQARGWHETAGPYIVPGESRTRWINLRDAEGAIPALHALLDAAQRREFDVLVLYTYDRLRELLDPVSRTLAAYGVQLYSVSQPIEPMAPESYDLYATDTSSAVQFVSSLTSRAEINAIRRRWRIGIPQRVQRGLHASSRAPYGYRKPPGREWDAQAALVPDPVTAAICVKMKDLYLAGRTIKEIQAWLDAHKIPPPRGPKWGDFTIRYILHNPFYAGEVFHGRQRVKADPRSGKARVVWADPRQIVRATGQHEPLWDRETYEALQDEMKRRAKRHKGSNRTQRLSHLLTCSKHGQALRVDYTSKTKRQDPFRIWFCPHGYHVRVRDRAFLDEFIPRLIADLDRIQDQVDLPGQAADQEQLLASALQDLMARKERLTDALEAGTLDAITYGQRVQALDQRITETRGELGSREHKTTSRAAKRRAYSALAEALRAAPDFLRQGDPVLVNQQLRSVIEKIVLEDDGSFRIVYL